MTLASRPTEGAIAEYDGWGLLDQAASQASATSASGPRPRDQDAGRWLSDRLDGSAGAACCAIKTGAAMGPRRQRHRQGTRLGAPAETAARGGKVHLPHRSGRVREHQPVLHWPRAAPDVAGIGSRRGDAGWAAAARAAAGGPAEAVVVEWNAQRRTVAIKSAEEFTTVGDRSVRKVARRTIVTWRWWTWTIDHRPS
jgi:hypothetical protein